MLNTLHVAVYSICLLKDSSDFCFQFKEKETINNVTSFYLISLFDMFLNTDTPYKCLITRDYLPF